MRPFLDYIFKAPNASQFALFLKIIKIAFLICVFTYLFFRSVFLQ